MLLLYIKPGYLIVTIMADGRSFLCRWFLTAATLDCFQRSKMKLLPCLIKEESSPRQRRIPCAATKRTVVSWHEVGPQCYPGFLEYCCTLGRKKNLWGFDHRLKFHEWFHYRQFVCLSLVWVMTSLARFVIEVAVVAHEHRGIKKSDSAIQDFILTPILPVSF